VLNQFGSPSINSNTLANRPTFGQPGRLFVSTDTLAIYRDTGTAWDNLTTGGSQNLEQVTTIGNTSTKGIFLGASGSLTAGKLLEVKGSSLFTGNSGNLVYIGSPSVSPNSASLDVYGYTVLRNTVNSAANLGPILYSQYTINYAGTQLSGYANSLFAQDIYNVSSSTTVASTTQSGTTLAINTYNFSNVATITFNQPSGTIRAASAVTAYSQFQNTAAGTITHAAGICILGIENLGGSALNITDNYQLLINASDEFASTATFTRQWGIYQNGANDTNYFAGNIQIKKDIVPVNQYSSLLGSFSINFANVYTQNITNTATPGMSIVCSGGPIQFSTLGNYAEIARFEQTSGNLLLGTQLNPNSVKLKINGNVEITTPTATGIHTATSQHLPIYVNGVLYYLQLLN
jgi:hypothetical protein